MNDEILRWGILGPGNIAVKFAQGIRDSRSSRLQAVGSRDRDRAEAFIRKHGGESAYGSYDELLGDPNVDAVYIATPHPYHVKWAIRAAEAGKHVLCEKPVGMNHGEAEAIFEAGITNGVFVMEAFMYRCYPQTETLYQWIRDGKLGEPQLVEAAFAYSAPYNPQGRQFANELGGGGILDVGCYPVSASRMIAGAMEGKPFLDPECVCGGAVLGPTGVDESAAATLAFSNGLLAQCITGVRLQGRNQLQVTGREARMTVESPWFGKGRVLLESLKGEPLETLEPQPAGYQFEIDVFATEVCRHRGASVESLPPVPVTWMSPEDTLGNIRTLDRWRASVGLVYEMEKGGAGGVPPVRGGELQLGEGPIRRESIAGFEKPMSTIALGLDNQPDLPFLRTQVDAFVERGGNVLDTAFIYGAGLQERLFGEYLSSRPGLREQLFIISKVGHTPYCYPDVIHEQFSVSLERLQVDSVDLLMLHRDNLEVPVEEFVDALNREKEGGRIHRYGLSNWTLERIQEMNEVAESKGLEPVAAVSNNFSLADMVQPVWEGCLSAKDPAMKAWLKETGTLLFPWSSQARGFFTDRSGPDKREDEELVASWYSDENFERKNRAQLLADHYKVTALNINLAWVLAQPFPVCPLVGPRRLSELRTLLPGLEIQLSEEEVVWLDLETDDRPSSLS